MKRFSSVDTKVLGVWLLGIIGLLGLAFYQNIADEDIHTQRFCAYGHVYVEFEHNGKTWGTTFLDSRGRPLRCDDDENIKENINIII